MRTSRKLIFAIGLAALVLSGIGAYLTVQPAVAGCSIRCGGA